MNVPHKVIFLNGPPGCGKDTIARHLYILGGRHMKFAEPLKAAARAMFHVSDALWKVLEVEGSQSEKDLPRAEFFGKSWRETLIWLSEEVMKPQYGDDIFGKLALTKLWRNNLNNTNPTAFTVFSDCGFGPEVSVVADAVGHDNCQLWRIQRPGCSFKNDSRGYVDVPNVSVLTFHNEHDMDMLKIQIKLYLDKFVR